MPLVSGRPQDTRDRDRAESPPSLLTASSASAARVGYAVTFWTDPWGVYVGWRFSIAVQFIPAAIFAVGLPFLPESYARPHPASLPLFLVLILAS